MRFKAYGLSFRGKSSVFPLASDRAALDASRSTFFKGKTLYTGIRDGLPKDTGCTKMDVLFTSL